jgi:hypothetical protein
VKCAGPRLDLNQSRHAWIERRAVEQSKPMPPDDAGKPPGELLHFHSPTRIVFFFERP